MKIVHIIMPDSLDGKLSRIYFDERNRRPEYSEGVPYDEWLHSYILFLLEEVAAKEDKRLAEEALAVEEARKKAR